MASLAITPPYQHYVCELRQRSHLSLLGVTKTIEVTCLLFQQQPGGPFGVFSRCVMMAPQRDANSSLLPMEVMNTNYVCNTTTLRTPPLRVFNHPVVGRRVAWDEPFLHVHTRSTVVTNISRLGPTFGTEVIAVSRACGFLFAIALELRWHYSGIGENLTLAPNTKLDA